MKPIEDMQARLSIAEHDSSTALFLELLYFGELLVKLLTIGMLAALEPDRDRHRYRLEHGLVRSGGVGDWRTALEDMVVGPSTQHVRRVAKSDRNEISQRFNAKGDEWQALAATQLNEACRALDKHYERHPDKVSLIHWLQDFVWLRNKTRGHGATKVSTCDACGPLLAESLQAVAENAALFKRPWAHLKRNLSGKYRVLPISQTCEEFSPLKRATNIQLADGIYIFFEEPSPVSLMETDLDISDFYVANGGFREKTYELLSYKTDERKTADSTEYSLPPTALPPSETQGLGGLEVQGQAFGNIPPPISDYVARPELEKELTRVLTNDRHPMVTLVGRGGIGKTSLALKVLRDIACTDRFFSIIWFSSRDIDLLPEGPKVVRPQVLSVSDIAEEFVELIKPAELFRKEFNSVEFLNSTLSSSNSIGPVLFVFDNFETVRNPSDLYSWLDTYVRPPNKILITTRNRDFKGDYPVEVPGMTEMEFTMLVEAYCKRLGISHLLTQTYLDELFAESDGHPYVIKVLLGHVAIAGKARKVERVMANQADILDALFDRTYTALSPAAQRVFLTLCGWRSTIALFALEAALLRPENEKMDVAGAIDLLERSSLVQVLASPEGDQFVTVPLAAALFGKKRLAVSALKRPIESDLEVLQFFGATNESEVQRGITPRVSRFMAAIEASVRAGSALEKYLPVLEYVARKIPSTWLLLADLYGSLPSQDEGQLAAENCIRRYLEAHPEDGEAWRKLAVISRTTSGLVGEIEILLQGCEQPGADFFFVSSCANYINHQLAEHRLELGSQVEGLVTRLLKIAHSRFEEADATDCSRFAWLQVRSKRHGEARETVAHGLRLEPSNLHCLKLAEKLQLN